MKKITYINGILGGGNYVISTLKSLGATDVKCPEVNGNDESMYYYIDENNLIDCVLKNSDLGKTFRSSSEITKVKTFWYISEDFRVEERNPTDVYNLRTKNKFSTKEEAERLLKIILKEI